MRSEAGHLGLPEMGLSCLCISGHCLPALSVLRFRRNLPRVGSVGVAVVTRGTLPAFIQHGRAYRKPTSINPIKKSTGLRTIDAVNITEFTTRIYTWCKKKKKKKSHTFLSVVYSLGLGIMLLIFLISSRVRMTKHGEITRERGESQPLIFQW